ncbi:EamA family transporter [Psychrobacter sp. DM4]|uniref:EamA family transporter n=1 Tax=Psychrobacter sp. DM4 TaxID=3440637 RepID=UPI003F507623
MIKNGLPAPYVMLVLAPLLWATSNVTGKLGKGWLTPYEMTFFRWFIATLILTFFARRLIEKDWAMIKQHLLWLFIVGGGGFALFNIVLYSASSLGQFNVGDEFGRTDRCDAFLWL